MTRLTDNDKKFLGITYGKVNWKAFRLALTSKCEDKEIDNCNLTLYLFNYAFRINLPDIIKPYLIKRKATYWDQATIERMGRDWYYDDFPRVYGFSLHEGFLQLFYGIQSDGDFDDVKHQSKSWFLPWKQFRLTKQELYDHEDKLFWKDSDLIKTGKSNFNEFFEHKQKCPTVNFLVKDYDGAVVKVKTILEVKEWKHGKGKFKWISWFKKTIKSRTLELEFEEGVGKDKGSWKGGLVGISVKMPFGMSREEAIEEFCKKNQTSKNGAYRLEFLGNV